MSFEVLWSGSNSTGRLYYCLEVRGRTGTFQQIFKASQVAIDARPWLASFGEDVPASTLNMAIKRAPYLTVHVVDAPGFVVYRDKLHFVSPATTYGPFADQLQLFSDQPLRVSDWCVAGSLKDWDDGAKRFCQGNPLLIVVLATAMSAPILARMGDVHPYVVLISGSPAQGKSIATQLAAATYGSGPDQLLGRLMPANVSEKQIDALLLANNGAALFIDDPRQQTANQVESARVMAQWTFNTGSGTTRLRTGGDQTETRFWTLLFATSNDTPEQITKMGGQRTDTASADRIMHLPAKRRYGVFDAIPEGTDPSDHALQLQAFARTVYGAPMDAVYLRLVQTLNRPDDALKLRTTFLKDRSAMQERFPLRDSSGGRTRRRAHFLNSFAAACALSDMDLIPFSAKELSEAFDEMYLCSEESSSRPHTDLRKVLTTYITDNLNDMIRLAGPLADLDDEEFRNACGFVRHQSEAHYEVYLPPAAMNRLTSRVRSVGGEFGELADQGVMAQEHDGPRTRWDVKRNVRSGGADRVYVIRSSIFDEQ